MAPIMTHKEIAAICSHSVPPADFDRKERNDGLTIMLLQFLCFQQEHAVVS